MDPEALKIKDSLRLRSFYLVEKKTRTKMRYQDSFIRINLRSFNTVFDSKILVKDLIGDYYSFLFRKTDNPKINVEIRVLVKDFEQNQEDVEVTFASNYNQINDFKMFMINLFRELRDMPMVRES